MDDLDELLLSHDELVVVCAALMNIIMDQGLDPLMEKELSEVRIVPGFANRAEQVKTKFIHKRRLLMASGAIQ